MQCKTQRSALKHNALCFQLPCIEEEADSWSLTEWNATKHTTDSCIVNQCAATVVCYKTHCNWFAVCCVAFRGSQSLFHWRKCLGGGVERPSPGCAAPWGVLIRICDDICVLCDHHHLHHQQQQQLLQDQSMSFIIITKFIISPPRSSWSWSAWIICNQHGPHCFMFMIIMIFIVTKNKLSTCVIGPPCISREARLVGGPGSPVHSGNDHINYCVLSFLIILDNNWFCWLTIFLKLDNDLSSRIMINNPWW